MAKASAIGTGAKIFVLMLLVLVLAVGGLLWFDYLNLSFVDFVPYLFSQPNLSPAGINLSGPSAGLVDTPYSFDASVYPIATVKPVVYVWQATGQTPVTHTADALQDTASFTWHVTGTKRVTLTASNREGSGVITHTFDVMSPSSSDAYEADDTSSRARSIPTDGTPQLHTFHAADDVGHLRCCRRYGVRHRGHDHGRIRCRHHPGTLRRRRLAG